MRHIQGDDGHWRTVYSSFAEKAWHKAWIWSQDGSPDWFGGYVTPYLWRPLCWARGWHEPHHCDVYFELCWRCWKPLWSKRRNGWPNPVRDVKFVPCAWRRWFGSARALEREDVPGHG